MRFKKTLKIMLSLSKSPSPLRRTEANLHVTAPVTPTKVTSSVQLPQTPMKPAVKRMKAGDPSTSLVKATEEEVGEEGNTHPTTTATPLQSEKSASQGSGSGGEGGDGEGGEKKKWNGRKEKNLSEIIASVTDSTYLRQTDTLNLADVWFLPIAVSRTSSKSILNVQFAIIISGVSLVIRDHFFKILSDDLLKMIYLVRRMRAYASGDASPISYETWHDKEFGSFLKNADIVRGDSSEAAFAEYQFSVEDFRMIPNDAKCMVRGVFRKTNQHIYIDDVSANGVEIYGENENPNVIQCVSARGSYSFSIEIRMMILRREEEDTEKHMDENMSVTLPI